MTDDLTRPTETSPDVGVTPSAASTADAGMGEPAGATATTEAATSGPASTESVARPASAMDSIMAGSPGAVAGRGTRLRWVIALAVVGVVAVVAVGAYMLLASKPVPEALRYIPSDAAIVVEIRPDIPGDQLQKLGNLLAHFPGFKDQSTLPDKLDVAFTRLVGQGSGGKLDYRTDLKPWLSGPAFLAFRVEAGGSSTDPASMARGVISLTTTGTVTCDALLKNQTVTHETYNGLTLTLGPGNGAAGDDACVVDGRQALIGDKASVHAAIDAHAAGSGLDKSATYMKARASLQTDQLATLYLDGKAYSASLATMLQGLQATPGVDAALLPGAMPTLPEWVVGGIRAEDDAVVMDSFTAAPIAPSAGATPGPSLLPIPAAHPSVLSAFAPANTVFFLEAQGAGVSLQNMLSVLRTSPQLQQPLQMLDGVGGAGPLLGWIQDAGVVVVNGTDGPTGGVLVAAPDEATASGRVSTLLGLLSMLGLGNSSVQTHESTIAGVKVTTITISDLGSLIPPGQLPGGVTVPAGAKVEFSIASKGQVILLGTGESFMNAVLSTTVQSGAGMVDQDLYKHATSRALANSQATLYVDIRDLVALAEKAMPSDAKAKWETDVKPYIAPFEALSMWSSTVDGSSGHARFALTVGNP